MNVLIHVCCGPCLIYPLKELRAEGHSVTGLFYNPNIHPYTEFKARMSAMDVYAKDQGLHVVSEMGYDMEEYFRRVAHNESNRCSYCYEMRLRKTAVAASLEGFDAFTSTLLYSRYQKHDLIVQIANVVAKDIGIKFLYRDFREGWDYGQTTSRELSIYRQKYCGCVYSEKERFLKKPRLSAAPR